MFSRIIDAVREDRDSRETRAEIGLQIWKAKLWAMYHVDVQRFTISNRLSLTVFAVNMYLCWVKLTSFGIGVR